jgi:hypothetical protein
VVALAVPDEPALLELRRALALAQLDHKLVVENEGRWANQAMAIGVTPTRDRAAVRRATSALPLVR